MDTWLFAAALASALLHAAWNAAVKASAAPREAMSAQMNAAALITLPLLSWAGLPPPAAWPWIAATVLLGVATLLALLRAYESGGFGTVYPMARALSVCGVAALVPWVVGERLGAAALGGIGLIAAALLVLAWDARGGARIGTSASGSSPTEAPGIDRLSPNGRTAGPAFPAQALAWTLLAGATSAACVLADARGVRATAEAFGASASTAAPGLAAALSYGATVSLLNAAVMAWLVRDAGAPWTLVRRHARIALPAACASSLSYLLILWVFQHAPVALAAALRDTSALFAVVIAVLWLKEPLPARRLAALLLALAALPLLRLGDDRATRRVTDMFGSFIVELVLGLCFLFAVLGLVTTAITESALAVLGTRAAHLKRWLEQWTERSLGRAATVEALLSHPLLAANRPAGDADGTPSYLPPQRLASALLSTLGLRLDDAALAAGPLDAAAALRAQVLTLAPALQQSLLPLLDRATARTESGHHGAQLFEAFTTEVANWIDESMARIEGWTRRRAKVISLCAALLICGAFNVSAYDVLRQLSADPALRTQVAQAAMSFSPKDCAARGSDDDRRLCHEQNAREAAEVLKGGASMSALGIGWEPGPRFLRLVAAKSPRLATAEFVAWLLGVVVAAWAASLGGDFWFKWIAEIVRLTGSRPAPPPR